MSLPIFNSDSQEMSLMQTRWASILDPIIKNPAINGLILTEVALVAGSNTINHKLGRKLQGWKLVRQKAASSIYDNQDNNKMQDLTLILVSSSAVTVSIEVF